MKRTIRTEIEAITIFLSLIVIGCLGKIIFLCIHL